MKNKVLFRRSATGRLLAVFPNEYPTTYDPLLKVHVSCSCTWVRHCTSPATPAEARQLRAALKARGYGPLQVLKRWPRGKGGAP